MTNFSRRIALKAMAIGGSALGLPKLTEANEVEPLAPNATTVSWTNTHDRVWLDGRCWANPMEDWSVVDGAAECGTTLGNRNVHLVTHQLTNTSGQFQMSVVISQVEVNKKDFGVGFKIGIHSELNEYRSNSFALNGIAAGLVDGKLVIDKTKKSLDGFGKPESITLTLQGKPAGNKYELTLSAADSAGNQLGAVTALVGKDKVLGNVAIFNNFTPGKRKKRSRGDNARGGSRYRFNDWSVSGDAFTVSEENTFGPILWSMYSLSDSRSDEGFVMKLTALTGPLGDKNNQDGRVARRVEWPMEIFGDGAAWTPTLGRQRFGFPTGMPPRKRLTKSSTTKTFAMARPRNQFGRATSKPTRSAGRCELVL